MTVYAFNAKRSHKARLLHLEKVFNLLPGGQPHLAGGDRLHGKGERLRTTPTRRMGRRALPPPNRVPVTEYYIGF